MTYLLPAAARCLDVLVKRQYRLRTVHATTISEQIAQGHYDYVDPLIVPTNLECDPAQPMGRAVSLLKVPGPRYTQQIIAWMAARRYRPATIPELLSIGATYPRLQYRYTIISLGSTWIDPGWGFELCIALSSDTVDPSLYPPGRHLQTLLYTELLPFWRSTHRFAAVPIQ
jgi:hypothetical protein